MRDFVTFNALGLFSMIILLIVFQQASNYLENENNKLKKLWLSSIAITFVVQLIDIICWCLIGVPGKTMAIVSYVFNILLFNSVTIMSCKLALFVEYSVEFSDKVYNVMRKVFGVLIGINFILSILSIPLGTYFSLDQQNNYSRGNFFVVHLLIGFLPLIFVLTRVLIKNNSRSIKTLLLTGIICPIIFVFLQITSVSPIPLIFPSVTTFVLIMNSLLTLNSMYIDYLTGLKNTRGIDRYFSDMSSSIGSFLVVVFIDLNEFKLINDRYGHKEGDNALCAFSKILTKTQKSDDLTGRIGGDEFLIVTKLNNPNNINLIINKIKNEISKYNDTSLKPYKLSICYGISINPPKTLINKDLLIEDSDRKMYEQKAKKMQVNKKEAL